MTRRLLAHLGAITLTTAIAVVGAPGMVSADEVRDDQWYLEDLGIDDAHELSQGEGVTIGVIDSGIDATHPDLEDNVKPGKGYGDAKEDGLHDARDHGTSVTSILAGHGHGDNNQNGVLGIAPKAEIISVGMHCDDDKCDGRDATGWYDEAFKWLADQEVDIISISMSKDNDTSDAVEYATERGIPVVAAAGNTKVDYGEALGVQETNRTVWPARAPGAIPVTGVDQDGEFWEDSVDLRGAAHQPQFGLSAPATDLPGAMPGGDYATNSGTSGAAPIVAGTLALIKSAYPDLTYDQWLDRLLDTVDDKGEEGFDDEYGWGTVNPLDALTEETTYEDSSGEHVSSPDDRLPLEEQGKGTGDAGSTGEGNDDEGTADGSSIAATTGFHMWLIIAIIAGLLIVTAAIITPIVFTQRRKNTKPAITRLQTDSPAPDAHHPEHPPPRPRPACPDAQADSTPGSPSIYYRPDTFAPETAHQPVGKPDQSSETAAGHREID